MPGLVAALSRQHPCFGDCHRTLSRAQRARAIDVIYLCDDALRGWGYTPIYDIDGDRLFKDAQQKNDPTYRGVAVRFGECIYRRLVGSMLHESLHANFGDTTKPNYGIHFALPYGVPREVDEKDEDAFLAPFNVAEARAFVGVGVLAARMGIDWPALNARDYGTFGFTGGNALVRVPPGFRAVAHLDPVAHADRYMPKARALEAAARAWFTTEDNVRSVEETLAAAAAKGRATRVGRYPAPEVVADTKPERVGRNDHAPARAARK
jgi:hypothetical protein